jgi:hypothetical protein
MFRGKKHVRHGPCRLFRRARLQLEPLEERAVPATITWANSSGGDWDTAANWSPAQVPGAGDDAVINTAGITITHGVNDSDSVNSITSNAAFTLSISSGSLSVASASTLSALTQSGGTLTGAGTVTVSGLLTWSGGTMSGSGLTVANGGMTLSGTHFELLSGRTFDNNGTANWTGDTNYIEMQSAAVWNNESGGVLDSENAGQEIYNDGGAASTFNNAGLFELTTGATTTTSEVAFNNTGSVNVQVGELSLTGGGADSGTGSFTVAAGATLGFDDSATTNFSGSASVSGAGTGEFGSLGEPSTTNFASGTTYDLTGGITCDGGTLNFNAGANVQAIGSTLTCSSSGGIYFNSGANYPSAFNLTTLSISSGTVDFSSGAAINVMTLNQSGGILTGSDTITVSGVTTWSSQSTMSGSGTLIAQGGLTISDPASSGFVYLNTRTLENFGTATFASSGGNYFQMQGSTIINEAGATWNLTGEGFTANSGADSFNNEGIFNSAGSSEINVPFTNSGSVAVNSGALTLGDGGGSSGGSITIAMSSTLDFDSSYGLNGTTGVSGSGSVTLA